MNDYIKNLLLSRLDLVENKDGLIKTCHLMNQFGVNSDNDLKDYFYITNNIRKIAKNVFQKTLDDKDFLKVSLSIFNNRDCYPINNIFNFYKASEVSLNKSGISITKIAYPQGFDSYNADSPHDINKWKKAAYAIGFHINQGQNENSAIQLVTKNWEKMEQNDFKSWIRFYQEGADKKYNQHKTAQNRFMELGQGAFLPIKNLQPGFTAQRDFNNSDDLIHQFEMNQKQNQEDESMKQIRALIGRLNSAERLATTSGIEKALGNKYEPWLRALYDLKREIQVSMLKSKRASLVPDMVIRKANQLLAAGHAEPARLMMKIAQVSPPPVTPELLDENLPESESGDAPMPEFVPDSEIMDEPLIGEELPEEESDDAWVEEFLNGLAGKTETYEDTENQDQNDSDDFITVSEDEIIGLKTYAQLSEQTPLAAKPFSQNVPTSESKQNRPPQSSAPNNQQILTNLDAKPSQTPGNNNPQNQIVTLNKPVNAPATQAPQNTDTPANQGLDAALKSITVKDIVDRLEKLQTVFQTREISNQLSLSDAGLSALGLSSYFPEIGEATAKSLDANQYCLTRIEDVLSKLRGSDITHEQSFDLEGKEKTQAKENGAALVSKLNAEKNKEDERKKAKEIAQNAKEDIAIDAINEPELPVLQSPEISPSEQISNKPVRIVPPTAAKV